MNLVRMGHYFTPRGAGDGTVSGACQTAFVCGPGDVAEQVEAPDLGPVIVNLSVYRHDGMLLGAREGIPVEKPDEGHDSFHLSGDCPWGK